MSALSQIELYAGIGPNGQAVVERLQVHVNDQDQCQLVRSPAFVKGVASGDVIKLGSDGKFELIERSGNLAIRVIARDGIGDLADTITPELEKLGGSLDVETPRLLVYSIHVSCGFATIEALFNGAMTEGSSWFYGKVYDPQTGEPLNWWNAILGQV